MSGSNFRKLSEESIISLQKIPPGVECIIIKNNNGSASLFFIYDLIREYDFYVEKVRL
jgi:hypothetical protein